MKKFILIALIGAVLIGCKKDDDSNDGDTPLTGSSLTAKIDNVEWKPSLCTGVVLQGTIGISATDGGTASKAISIHVPETTSTGTFNIGPTEKDYLFTYNVGTTEMYVGTSGTITLTKHDKTAHKIEGSFNVTAQSYTLQSHTLTGSFKVTYMGK